MTRSVLAKDLFCKDKISTAPGASVMCISPRGTTAHAEQRSPENARAEPHSDPQGGLFLQGGYLSRAAKQKIEFLSHTASGAAILITSGGHMTRRRQLVTDKSLHSVWEWSTSMGVANMTLKVKPNGKAVLDINFPDDWVEISFNNAAIMRELAESLLKGANCIDRQMRDQKRETRNVVT